MKRYALLLAALSFLMTFIGCESINTVADPNYDDNATIEWRLREVLQYDPININGINLIDEFDFFNTFGFKLYREDGKFTALECNSCGGFVTVDHYFISHFCFNKFARFENLSVTFLFFEFM